MKSSFFTGPTGTAALAVIVFASLFLQLGSIPLFDEDEGAYAEVSREMVESGDWLVPRLEGKPFFHKPPMIYWAQAVSIQILGLNEFALRLPSALASAAWSMILFVFVRRYIGSQDAWFAVFFLISALQTSIITKAAIADALLNLFITITMLALYVHYQSGTRGWLLIAFAGMALGFLTKGPIAIAIPVVVSAFFYLLQKGIVSWLKIVFYPLGWLIFLLIALPWYIALIASFGMSFVNEIFMVHNLGRFQNAMEGHSGPIFYYIPVIIAGLVPYTTIVIVAFVYMRRHWNSELGRFLILWFAFVFVLFSLAGTKLQHYIVYGYVPLLIFMAQAIEHLKRPLALIAPMVCFSAIILFLPAIASWLVPYIDDEFSQHVIKSALNEFGLNHYLIIGTILIAVVTLSLIKPFTMQLRIVAAGLLFLMTINFYLMPKVADIMQQPIKSAALYAKKHNWDVVMWQMYYPSFNVYLGRPVLRRDPLPGDVVITKANKLDGIRSHQVLYQKHGFVLTRITEL
jgi:4-amino-4-deoxy-L-arabinose transferase-like glycosyltransferase